MNLEINFDSGAVAFVANVTSIVLTKIEDADDSVLLTVGTEDQQLQGIISTEQMEALREHWRTSSNQTCILSHVGEVVEPDPDEEEPEEEESDEEGAPLAQGYVPREPDA